MLSLDRNDILRVISSSDEGGLLIGHTDVLSRTAEHRGHVEVGNFRLLYDMNVKRSQGESLRVIAWCTDTTL